MGEIYLWEEMDEIMAQASKHTQQAPALRTSAKETAAATSEFLSLRRLCNDSSQFHDFGHFIIEDSGYTGGDRQWKLEARAPSFRWTNETIHNWEYFYSA